MKKLAILGASAVLAAMPVVGVFAVDTTTVTDNISISVPKTCTLGVAEGKTVTGEISNGNTNLTLGGSELSITCNDGTGWNLTAEGAGSGSDKTQLINGEFNIPTVVSEPATTSSSWAFKLNGTGVQETYQDWAAVPASAQVVAKDTKAVDKNKVTVTYGVGIDADQEAGTYTGAVKFVLAQGAGE